MYSGILAVAGAVLLVVGYQMQAAGRGTAAIDSIFLPDINGKLNLDDLKTDSSRVEEHLGYRRMFLKLDADNDNFLNRTEVENSARINFKVVKSFDDADKNKDGKLSMTEFRDAIHASTTENSDAKEDEKKLEKEKSIKKEETKPMGKRTKKKRPPPYPTYPPPHSPKSVPPATPFPPSISESRSRHHYIFTVDNRDVRGKGYRPFVAAANQMWAMLTPLKSAEKHEYIYLRSNLSCHITDCPTFPNGQRNKVCCEGPVYNKTLVPGAIGSAWGGDKIKEGEIIPVHPSWMDLKGILYMLDNVMEYGDIGVYLDSDAHFDFNKNKTFFESYGNMLPEFMNGTRPVAVVRDRSHWTAVCHADFGGPYTIDANSGIIMFTKNENARAFFERMWQSALVISPQEKRKENPLHYQFGWPHEQERLSWFASTKVENASVTYIQRMGWMFELPWCFQAICHRNFDKMPYIGDYVKESLSNSANCSVPEIKPYCNSSNKIGPEKYNDFVESLLDKVKVVPM